MLSLNIRRLLALPLAFALAVALIAHPLYAATMGMKAAAMTADMVATSDMSMDMSKSGKCDGCAGDEKGTMPTTCATFCSGIVGQPLVPNVSAAVPLGIMWPPAEAAVSGRTIPPEPHPPKSILI